MRENLRNSWTKLSLAYSMPARKLDSGLARFFPTWHAQIHNWRAPRIERRKAAKGFDLGWARGLLTLSTLSFFSFLILDLKDLEWVTLIGGFAFGILLTFYFGFLLFRRLQCSLLEWIVIIILLGNFEGLVFSTPALASAPMVFLQLGLLILGWVFYGAVLGLVRSRLLNVATTSGRIFLILAGCLGTADLALLAGGTFLILGRSETMKNLLGKSTAAWGWPVLAFGLTGLVLESWLYMKTRRAARAILMTQA